MEQLDSSSMLATPPLFGFRVYERDSDDNTMTVSYLSKTSLARIDVQNFYCQLVATVKPIFARQKYYLPLTDI